MASRFSMLGGDIVLKTEEFRLLRDLFSGKLGIHFGPEARFSVERRLRERLAVLNLGSFAEYYQHLRFNPLAGPEWDEAIEALTTNETYFYREDYQLRSFAEEVLPLLAMLAKPRKRLSIWSAGCSSGEEVYTLAMLVHGSGLFDGWDVRVYGSDISKRCIAAARRAVYGVGSFRAMPIDLKRQYFTEKPDGAHVSDALRSMCHFGQMNLLDEDKARILGRADAIFCRNVLIYFDQHARKRVIDIFHERLYSGGVLFLGHSESLLNVSTAFELLHLKEDLVYRKPIGQAREAILSSSGVRSSGSGRAISSEPSATNKRFNDK
jgi:chemotaxis protein methyltransferase CheR